MSPSLTSAAVAVIEDVRMIMAAMSTHRTMPSRAGDENVEGMNTDDDDDYHHNDIDVADDDDDDNATWRLQ